MKLLNNARIRIVLLYSLFSGLWILLSDRILAGMVRDADVLSIMQTYKGFAFVLISAFLLNLLIKSEERRDQQIQQKHEQIQYRLLEELERKNEETLLRAHNLSTLNLIARTLAGTFKLGDIFASLDQALYELLPDISNIHILLLNAGRHELNTAYASKNGKPIAFSLNQMHQISDQGEDPHAMCIRTHQTQVVKSDIAGMDPGGWMMIIPMETKNTVVGLIEIHSQAPTPSQSSFADLMKIVGNTAAIAIQNAVLFEQLEGSVQQLSQAYDATIDGWAQAMELRDHETAGHNQRVTELTMRLARKMKFPKDKFEHMRRGALLHDIGKMGIPDSILLKAGPLTPAERKVIQHHPEFAHKMLVNIEYLRPAIDIPYCHHEHWDGSGYPRGLSGEEIPLAARIFAVVDVWDALVTERPYHLAWSPARARAHLHEQSGRMFDPQVVEAFLELEQERNLAMDRETIPLSSLETTRKLPTFPLHQPGPAV